MIESQKNLSQKQEEFIAYLLLLLIVFVIVLIVAVTRPPKIAFESFRDGNFEIGF